ncbi:alpha/beta fold hydrolase [Henriciella marina]|uniref:alpha/beta fold hydrolase n=1 Tax=Henriciella marina TaxID=453851 RepID=UPI00037A0D9B|nr:alpha/beta hydrolase [Henriciella marina]
MDETTRAAKELLEDLRPRSPSAAPGQNLLPPDTRFQAEGEFGTTPLWRAGPQGATTLFIHGWDDTHRVWRHFAMDFIQNGRPVLLMDLPGHGASQLEACNWKTAGQCVHDVTVQHGPVDAIITHSFGGRAAARAIELGAEADYLIMIAPPLSLTGSGFADRQRKKGVSEAVIEEAERLYREELGYEIDGPDMAAALSRFDGKIVVIGSHADEQCPIEPMRALVDALENAHLVEFEGFGHRDLALSPDVLTSVLTSLDY